MAYYGFIWLHIAMLMVTYKFPHLVQPTGEQDVFTDSVIQVGITFSVATVLVDIFTRRYREQHLLLQQANEKLTCLASTDMLKEHMKDPALRSLHLAMIDIDHFKTVNDSYGHLVGDQVGSNG